ncbi:MAG: hypothetical protein U9N87_05175, partial [Planctomycetota bacterium]|nr:hypothetical protein [Planctomycetota bacterium]
ESAALAVDSKSSIKQLDTAIGMVPADAAFYSTMYRGQELMETAAKSKAWKKLMEIPILKMGWQFYEMQAASEESIPGKIDKAMQDPQVQDLLALLGDMFSTEAFVYGDASVIETIELFQQLNNINRIAPLTAQLEAKGGSGEDAVDERKSKAKMILAVLGANLDKVKVPGIILGFKLKDTQRAAAQLGKLDIIASFALAQQPKLAEAYKAVKIGDDNFLTITLTGEMIPWHELPLDDIARIESNSGDLKKVVEAVKKQKLVVAIGLRGDYLLLSVGPSVEGLKKLGNGTSLADRPEIKRLDQYAGRRLTGIGYVSERLNRSVAGGEKNLADLLATVDEVLPKSGLSNNDQARIRKDAAALIDDIKPFMPQPGAISGIEFITERGIEDICFNWGKYPQMDASKPLTILEHVGGMPLLAVAGRAKTSPENYDLIAKWVTIGYGYVEKFALPLMKPEDREKYDKLAKAVAPLVERLDGINREKLVPALADGQSALVVEAKLKTKQIHKALPASKEARPMIEPAIVIGLSDVDSFHEAVNQYWELLGDATATVGENLPDKPQIPLSEPTVQSTDVGTICSIELPEQAGLDKQIGLYLGFNESVAVFATNEAQTKRLLAKTKLGVGGVLTEPGRARSQAVSFNWPDTLTAAMPWIEFGLKMAAAKHMDPDDIETQYQIIKPQLGTLVEVLSVVRGITSETCVKDGVMVTHVLTEIRDVK